MFISSVDLPELLWICVMLIHNPLDFYPEENVHLFIVFKSLVNTLRNQYHKVTFIRLDEDGALARYSEFMTTRYNINIIVHTTGGYAS